jgi:hypothetical protein
MKSFLICCIVLLEYFDVDQNKKDDKCVGVKWTKAWLGMPRCRWEQGPHSKKSGGHPNIGDRKVT